jgi:hypothetical protein
VKNDLPSSVSVSQGYPHIVLAVRNSGEVSAKHVKIHLEFSRPEPHGIDMPTVGVYDWKGDKRHSFKEVTNFDFMFIGGQDWVLHAHDTEVFSFHMSTTTVIQTEPREIRKRPGVGAYYFTCTVWSESLGAPISQDLVVNVVENAPRQFEVPEQGA